MSLGTWAVWLKTCSHHAYYIPGLLRRLDKPTTLEDVPEPWTPPLTLTELGDECRLTLVGAADGTGQTLQDAADDLLDCLETAAVELRDGHIPPAIGWPDAKTIRFLWEIAEIAENGGDIRKRVFAPYESESLG